MNANREIIDAIRIIAGTAGEDRICIEDMTVVSVNEGSRTCVCRSVNGKAAIQNMEVRLMACVDDGELKLPAIDSAVVVCYSTRNAPFLLMYSAIDKIVKIAGNSGYSIVTDKLQLNDGALGGLVEAEPTAAAIKAMQQDINNLKNAFASVFTVAINEPGNGSPSALQLALATALYGSAIATPLPNKYTQQTLTVTERSDIENTNITHGNSL